MCITVLSNTHRRSGVEAARTGTVEVVVVAALRLVVEAAVLQAVTALLPVLARVGVVGDAVGDLADVPASHGRHPPDRAPAPALAASTAPIGRLCNTLYLL